MGIEAVMIVKNEEECLPRCLKSLEGIDRITILDTGSTDGTAEAVRGFKCDYLSGLYKWEDSFCKARNEALSHAREDWILVIDADEILEAGSLEILRQAIKDNPDALGFNFFVENAAGNIVHKIIRCHRRLPEIHWQGDAHNYLTFQDGVQIGAKIVYGYSPAHHQDPDRTLRILEKSTAANPDKPREWFYLAREYYTRHQYDRARECYQKYIGMSNFAPEQADALLMLARTAVALGDINSAWNACFAALKINADLSEAYSILSLLSGEVNRKTWQRHAAIATNHKALFVRDILDMEEVEEKGADYYQAIYDKGYDTSRYNGIYMAVAGIVEGKVLDMGCGTGALRRFLAPNEEYRGFDFAQAAEGDCFDVGDLYDYPLEGYDWLVMLEVLEHVDDVFILNRLPSGAKVVYTVPSFADPSHLRTYTDEIVRERHGHYIDIGKITRYNLADGRWSQAVGETENYILLVKGVRK